MLVGVEDIEVNMGLKVYGKFFIVVLFISIACFTKKSFALESIGKYKTYELVFVADTSPSNPFDTYLLKLEVTDPKGRKYTIDGFFDGDGHGGQAGKIWKARLAPYITGIWSWRTVSGDAPDSGLAGFSGQFECTESGDIGGVVADGQHFRFQNGDYVYLVGNFLDFANGLRTTHTFMSETTSDAQRDAIIVRQHDFHTGNKANIYFANRGDYGGQSVTPWVGTKESNDKTRMDLARWHLYDEYIRRFKENGMLAEMWFFADESSFGGLAPADKYRLFRYAMARTSAFSHTMYVIALEWSEGWAVSSVRDAGNFIQAHNPWGRLLSIHNHTDWAFSGDSWATFIATQAGNSARAPAINSLAMAMRNNESIPHLDEEYGILNSDTDGRLRGNLWANFTGGAAGGGTGSDLKAFVRFLSQSRAPFWRMRPTNSLVSGGGSTHFCLAEVGHHYIVYSTSGSFTLNVSASGLIGRWFNPRDPNATFGSAFNVSPGTPTFVPPNNSSSDWVLWISDNTNLGSGVMHPSTEAVLIQRTVTRNASSDTVPPAQPLGLRAG
jgi:hypothetical protein